MKRIYISANQFTRGEQIQRDKVIVNKGRVEYTPDTVQVTRLPIYILTSAYKYSDQESVESAGEIQESPRAIPLRLATIFLETMASFK